MTVVTDTDTTTAAVLNVPVAMDLEVPITVTSGWVRAEALTRVQSNGGLCAGDVVIKRVPVVNGVEGAPVAMTAGGGASLASARTGGPGAESVAVTGWDSPGAGSFIYRVYLVLKAAAAGANMSTGHPDGLNSFLQVEARPS